MKFTRREIIVWAPRVVGLGLAGFLGLFATDAFMESRGLAGTMVAFAMGLLPAVVVLAVVLIGWKHEGFAGLAFVAMTVFYAMTTLEHPAWIAVIAGPLALVAALFLYSWWVKTHDTGTISPSPSLPRR